MYYKYLSWNTTEMINKSKILSASSLMEGIEEAKSRGENAE